MADTPTTITIGVDAETSVEWRRVSRLELEYETYNERGFSCSVVLNSGEEKVSDRLFHEGQVAGLPDAVDAVRLAYKLAEHGLAVKVSDRELRTLEREARERRRLRESEEAETKTERRK